MSLGGTVSPAVHWFWVSPLLKPRKGLLVPPVVHISLRSVVWCSQLQTVASSRYPSVLHCTGLNPNPFSKTDYTRHTRRTRRCPWVPPPTTLRLLSTSPLGLSPIPSTIPHQPKPFSGGRLPLPIITPSQAFRGPCVIAGEVGRVHLRLKRVESSPESGTGSQETSFVPDVVDEVETSPVTVDRRTSSSARTYKTDTEEWCPNNLGQSRA